ncbi:MAG: helix-turn-helix domain-containing protein [Roseiarcus sp.]
MTALRDYTVFRHLDGENVPLRSSAAFGAGLVAALWDRDETASAAYNDPNHHTLSLYVTGGESFVRIIGKARVPSLGAGSLCLMPRGASSRWDVRGPVRMFHLYFSRQAFERVFAEVWRGRPTASLREIPYFRDPALEGIIRSAILPLAWNEPAERIAAGEAGQTLVAYLASRLTERGLGATQARGGLAPVVLKRVFEFVAENCGRPLSLDDIAACAGVSPFHFARAFKTSAGESPHRYVLRQRIEKAKIALRGGEPLAQVALDCGFGGQSHFSQRFRQMTGVTPSQYRRL